jgi:hypothetical protein
MFETIDSKHLKRGETYYIRISYKLGYIVTFLKLTTYMVMCTDVQLYDFERKKTYTNENDPYDETCYFSKYDIYLRIISKEEFMNKLIDVHANNMTNKILQTIINSDFIYY